MNYHRFKRKVFVPLLVIPTLMGAAGLAAQNGEQVAPPQPVTPPDTSIIDESRAIAEQAFQAARESQARINQLSDEADELLEQYREVSQNVNALEVYNAGMRRTIAQQERTIAQYDESIAQAAELQRQIPPLMERMMVALEQFVELDMPFLLEERRERLATVRDLFDDANFSVAERFRNLLVAYQQEANYGKEMDAYSGVLPINGADRDVDILRVGRIALLYQTPDETQTGMWDKEAKQWVTLGNEYTRPVRNAIRMAQDLTQIEMIEVPVPAPESAQ